MNKEYLEFHKNITIRIEMDEMWRFYQDKKHQIWLWWAIDHETGEAIAFWFGTREHENIDRLLELLEPLNLWKVYTVRFSKTEQMHKIVVALAINVWFFGRVCLLQ